MEPDAPHRRQDAATPATPQPAALPDADRWRVWDRFLESTPGTGFMQSSLWARFRADIGCEYFAVTIKDGDAIVGGALVGKWQHSPGQCFYYIQDGPVLPDDQGTAAQVFDEVLASVERHARAEDTTVSHLRIEPRWQDLPGFVGGFREPAFCDNFVEPRSTLCVDLRASEEDILAQMKPKGRYNVRVAQRHGVGVVEDNSAQGLVDFLRIQRRTSDRQRLDAKPPGYFRSLISELGPQGKVSLFFAEYRGRRLATALVVRFGGRATYFFGGSLVLHRRVMAPYLLHFEIMRAAKAAGMEWYDFWGVAPENEADHPWQDISTFKRKFGGVEVTLVPTLDRVYDSAAYERYVAAERETA